ncbi:hypothetical protein Droror1_Dr00027846 [Drosera rotundifolia]
MVVSSSFKGSRRGSLPLSSNHQPSGCTQMHCSSTHHCILRHKHLLLLGHTTRTKTKENLQLNCYIETKAFDVGMCGDSLLVRRRLHLFDPHAFTFLLLTSLDFSFAEAASEIFELKN